MKLTEAQLDGLRYIKKPLQGWVKENTRKALLRRKLIAEDAYGIYRLTHAGRAALEAEGGR